MRTSITDNLIFEYALRSPDGRYYTGRVNHENEPEAWLDEKHKAFTYTSTRAYAKVDSLECFRNFTVERIL
jgi:hypothetical protein